MPETYESKRCLRTSFYLRVPERPIIYAAKRQHISAVEKKPQETIPKTTESKREQKHTPGRLIRE